ncbi:MAG: response regulator [Bdellovibrionaceae bacterium]|nr:response regulator [Pseudobdellovibrionaceae bacterium]
MKLKFPIDYFDQKSFTYFMALRVLLADESPTIKKVFQLSLQDYGVEIKCVNVGGDVIEVTNDFKPDIIFADVLLQQMSGYQVSSEIKVSPDLKEIPIVLMWSGFMDIDEDKFQASHADAKLEKPFDVDDLRSIIQNLVPKVQTQNLSQFLDFPELPEFDEAKANQKEKAKKTVTSPNTITNTAPEKSLPPLQKVKANPLQAPSEQVLQKELQETDNAETSSYWNMESFEAVNITQQIPPRVAKSESKDQEFLTEGEEDSEWIQGNIEKFKLNVQINDNTNVEEEEVALERIIPESAVEAATRASSLIPPLSNKSYNNNEDMDLEIDIPPESHKSKSFDISDLPQLSEERLTDLIRAQSKEIVERVVWQVVPELATQIIERELKRLLAEQTENSLR